MRQRSNVSAAGAAPEPLKPTTVWWVAAEPGSATSTNASPPMPLECGCKTPSTASAAIAASIAEPPSPSAQSAASTASGFDVATIADRAQVGDLLDPMVTGSSGDD